MSLINRKKVPSQNNNSGLAHNLKTSDLIMLGVGAIVGTGIFTITGQAAATKAGPGLTISFIVAAIAVFLSGLIYAELASRIHVSGGTYGYIYVIMGEKIAWFVGWFSIIEFLLAVASVASGWSAYLKGLLSQFGIKIPQVINGPFNPKAGTYIDLLPILVLLLVIFWILQDAKKAIRGNGILVLLKFSAILLFIIVGAFYIKGQNYSNLLPFGFFGKAGHPNTGVFAGASLIFFAFLGFDSISMTVDEVKDPKKQIPRGILGSLSIVSILYIIVTLVLTGIVNYKKLNINDPIAFALRQVGVKWAASYISIVAILTLITVCISMAYSLSRLLYAISKDGLLPKYLSKISAKHHIPTNATWTAGILAMIAAGLFPLSALASLTNIVTLAYLIILAIALVILRKNDGLPDKNQFKVPFASFVSIVSAILCFYLMINLDLATWISFGIVIIIGLIIYFGYGYHHSELKEK